MSTKWGKSRWVELTSAPTYSSLHIVLSSFYKMKWNKVSVVIGSGYGKFSLRHSGSAMFGATFNLVTNVRLPYFWNTEIW